MDTIKRGTQHSVAARVLLLLALIALPSCGTVDRDRKTRAAPPPLDDPSIMLAETSITQDNYIAAGFLPPTAGAAPTLGVKEKCAFSSFHRKDTFGYEFDPHQRLAFRFSPDIDIFDIGDADLKVSLRYTRTFGPAPKKRPCTFGSGYYGLIPYFRNNPGFIGSMTDFDTIKHMIRKELD